MSISSDYLEVDSAPTAQMMSELFTTVLPDETWIKTVDLFVRFQAENYSLPWSIHRTRSYTCPVPLLTDSEILAQQGSRLNKYSADIEDEQLDLKEYEELEHLISLIGLNGDSILTSESASQLISQFRENLQEALEGDLEELNDATSLESRHLFPSSEALLFPNGCPEDPQVAQALILEYLQKIAHSSDLEFLQGYQPVLSDLKNATVERIQHLTEKRNRLEQLLQLSPESEEVKTFIAHKRQKIEQETPLENENVKIISCYGKVMDALRETSELTRLFSLEFTVIFGGKSNPHDLSRARYVAKEGRPGAWTVDKILPQES